MRRSARIKVLEDALRVRLRFPRGLLAAAAFFCLLAACLVVSRAQAGQAKAVKNVLLLFSQDSTNAPVPQAIYNGMCAVLDRSPKLEASVFIENLDLYLFPDEEAQQAIISFLIKKYVKTHIDLIVPVASPALNFAQRLREKLFPGIPIVYCVEVMQGKGPPTHRSDVTGTATTLDIGGTVELARRVRPGLTHVAVVAGTGATDQCLLALFREAFKAAKGKPEVIDLAGLPLGDVLEQASRLPASACILYLFVQRDGDGRLFPSWTVQKMVSQAANVPLFNLFDSTLGYGSVGGRMAQLEAAAVKTGELALRVLSGESPGAIEPVVISENPAMFDWRELRRWGIAESALPPGSIVRFRESSQWERHFGWVAGTLALICLLVLLVFVLGSNLVRRKRAEQEASLVRHELAHVARVSTVGQLGQSLAHEISQPLAAIRVNAEVAGKLLAEEPPDLREAQTALADIVADSKRAHEIIACIRTLVKNKPPRNARLDLNEVASAALQVVQAAAASEGVAIHLDLEADLPPVLGDSVQLQQAVLNLLFNAVDSVGENPHPPRLIRVKTAREPKGRLSLCVLDNGPGIAPEIAKRLFEPFFSSKPDGMGLGLSICRSIAEAHGGSLSVGDAPERGAAFCIHLPAGSVKSSKRPQGGAGVGDRNHP
jgi:signal transduction histidine kinase